MPLTLEEIFDTKRFEEKSLRQPVWLKDGRLAYVDDWPGSEKPTVWTFNPSARIKEPLFDPAALTLPDRDDPVDLRGVVWSLDGKRLLITGEAPARFKPCGDLYLYELDPRTFQQITRSEEPQYHPKFSPDGSTVGVVRGNNLCVIDVATGIERQLTVDGSETLYNGRCGWVYEEELGLADGWAWSPDGRTIAYLQQDESGVPVVQLPRFDHPHCEPEVTRYPKAGDPNPVTRLGLLDVASGETRWVELEESELSGYLAAMHWADSGDGLLAQILPRKQDRLTMLWVDMATGTGTPCHTETDARWVDHEARINFSANRDFYLWPSESDGRRHYYLRDPRSDWQKQLTAGPWDCAEVVGATSGLILFSAAQPDPAQRHLYRVTKDRANPVCLSESSPGSNRAVLSEDGKWLLHTHSSLSEPPTTVVRDTSGVFVETLSKQRDDYLKGVDLLPWEFVTFETTEGDTLHAKMLKPRDLAPGKRCPAIMHCYGGPGSQVVRNEWMGKSGLWFQMLAQEGYVVVAVDGRGTCGRGRDFKKQVYLRLGELETKDQIHGARYLQSLPYVDPGRIGIWGWSYGGYLATLCMLRGADLFRAGIAVAPVTDWTLYDSIYTERYMRTPAENPEGYRSSSPVHEAEKLRGKFLLIHGLSDDNVHFQHSARLAEALQDARKPFEAMIYPGKRHGIEDRHYHLYSAMTDFWRRNL